MKVYDGIEEFHTVKKAVVTSGTFDGVHLGHQKIIERLIASAKSVKGESVILTFWPHPSIVIYPEQKDLRLISTFDEKAQRLESLGVEHLLKIHFTVDFSKLSSQEFIQNILIDTLETHKLIIGYDHRFGLKTFHLTTAHFYCCQPHAAPVVDQQVGREIFVEPLN